MFRTLIFGLALVILSGCMLIPGNAGTQPTPLPTFAAAAPAAPANAPQTAALGGKQAGDYFVWIYSNPPTPIRGANTFDAMVTDAKGQPVADAKVSFDIDMTNMSHGKNVVEAKAMGAGRYSGNLNFMMPGPWRVIVAVNRDGQASSVRFDFNVNNR